MTTTFLASATDVTPSSNTSWTDTDLSSYIPASATGVLLRVVNTQTTDYNAGWRKHSSTDTFVLISYGLWTTVATGVDANRHVDLYTTNKTYLKIYLVGYFESEAYFFTNRTSYSVTTGGWYDVDISAEIQGGDTAVFAILTEWMSDTGLRYGNVRANGSSDARTGNEPLYYVPQYVGLDAGNIFEAYQNSTGTYTLFYLEGYVKSGAANFTVNSAQYTVGTANVWTDFASALPASAIGAYWEIGSPGASINNWGIRGKGGGHADDFYGKENTGNVFTFSTVSGCDAAQKVQYYSTSTSYPSGIWLRGWMLTAGIAVTLTAPTATTATNAPIQAVVGPTLTAPNGTTVTTAPTQSLATTLAAPNSTTSTNPPTQAVAGPMLTAPTATTTTNSTTQAIAGPTLTAPGGTTSTTAPTQSLATTLVEPAATTTTYAPTFAQATTISTTPAATTATNPPSPDVAPVIVAPTGTTSTSAPTFAQATTLTAPGGTTTTNAPTQAVAGPMLTSPTATTATDAPSLAVGIILESPTATTATTGTLIISQWGAIEIIHATYITTSRLSGVSKKTEGITAIKPVVTGGLRATCDLKIPHLTAVSKNSGVLTAISEVID